MLGFAAFGSGCGLWAAQAPPVTSDRFNFQTGMFLVVPRFPCSSLVSSLKTAPMFLSTKYLELVCVHCFSGEKG